MEQLDYRGKFDGALAAGKRAGGITVAQQEECWPKALPSPAEQITGNFGYGLVSGGALPREFLFDLD